MNKYVYLLRHTYEYGEDMDYEETKEIGVFSTKGKANEIIEKLWPLSGFCKYEKKCFIIEKFEIDKDVLWKEGFISWDEASGIGSE